MIYEEGISSLYWNRRLFPTVVHHILQPLFKHSTQYIIERWLLISMEHTPIIYQLCEFALGTLETAILLPVETVRRRLECQVLSKLPEEKRFEGMIECSKIPYTGMIDCAGRIIAEEGNRESKRKKRRAAKKERSTVMYLWKSIGGLYRGFKMRVLSNVAILLLRSFTIDEE
jgi:fusion and transport protein UGO1